MIQPGTQENETPQGTPGRAVIRYEPSPRWIRVVVAGETIADSRNALLVWEAGPLPRYYFPTADVRQDLLQEGRQSKSGRRYYDIISGDRVARTAAWSYLPPAGDRSFLDGYITFVWDKMDHWYEEEEEIIAHPRDPYHRVDTLISSRHVRVEIDGITLAESHRPVLLFETNLPTRYYLPREDIRMELLQPSQANSLCPYKGSASYWSVRTAGRLYPDIVWGYQDPLPEIRKIAGLLAFYNEKVDITVDGQLLLRPKTFWS